MTVLALADVVNTTAASNGSRDFPVSTFSTSYSPSALEFRMTSTLNLPVFAVADVLKGLQELTHWLLFLEMTFEVWVETSVAVTRIANGCLAFNCTSRAGDTTGKSSSGSGLPASTKDGQKMALRLSIPPLNVPRINSHNANVVQVEYNTLENASPIPDQSFADVSTNMLWNITDLIIASGGDRDLPKLGPAQANSIKAVDIWNTNFGISISAFQGKPFNLSQAATVLQQIQRYNSTAPMVESRYTVSVKGDQVGWGCLRYQNTSVLRCLSPSTGRDFSSVGTPMSSPFSAKTIKSR